MRNRSNLDYKSTFSTPMGPFGEALEAPGAIFASRRSRSHKKSEKLIFWTPPLAPKISGLASLELAWELLGEPKGEKIDVFYVLFLCRCENAKIVKMSIFPW